MPNGVKVVKAKAGDTVQKVAERYNANPTEVAKYNGSGEMKEQENRSSSAFVFMY